MWAGYKEQSAMKEFIDECQKLGLRVVDLHTSGHADPDTIRTLIEHVNPKEIIPIHTENPLWFSENIEKSEG